jgi:hypothetical protein
MLYEALFRGLHAARVRYLVEDFTIPLAGVPDLIAMKRIAGREQDCSDIDALTRLLQMDEGGPS